MKGSVPVRIQRRTMEIIEKIQGFMIERAPENGGSRKGLRPPKSGVIHAAVSRYWEEIRG
jgi:hypothetical protein